MVRYMLVLLILIVGATGIYFWLTTPTSTLQTRDVAAPAVSGPFAWRFTDLGEDSTGTLQTKVRLQTSAKTYDVGTFPGSCSDIQASSWKKLGGEITGAICWWAGGGKEIGLFSENGKLVAKVGDLYEGSAETPGVRGNFQMLLTIE